MQGSITTLKADRGFGFIKPDNGDKDVFFHASGMVERESFETLGLGDRLSFDIEEVDNKQRAANVRVLNT